MVQGMGVSEGSPDALCVPMGEVKESEELRWTFV